ncbi:probable E3 ubiquitin-protein ligase HERC4 isoform X1 [Sander lucioperca]|uniref:probable E3 ubiquitin-protein ligase HERC4 isoform X1 n=1 Tax=Sander lucioperca TaxID=283035 RepID=UPI001653D437|nr:probable E3 ubiquitin-protein ligase HERC4 isoform X1 [Sander lucioperca]
MFAWGEDSQRGFRLKDGSNVDSTPTTDNGVHLLNVSYHITDLCGGHNVLAFVKSNGNSFIIRTNVSKDGRRARGKQKFVECKEKIQAVRCGDDMVTLLSERGKVLCVDATRTYVPRPLEALCKIPVCQVACGSQHSVALTKDGQVYTWGQDSKGQLGLGKRKPGANSPQHLRSLSALPLVQIAAGGEQSFALSVSGGVFGWGRNHCGQLGLGDTTDRHTPTPVHCLNMKETIHISCGKDHTAILTKTGAVFTFGSGQYGQLGHNSFRDELRPRLVAELWGAKVTKTACGRHHTLVLTDSKRVYSFGCGEQGQLGHGEESHPSVPLPVQLPQDTTDDPKVRNIFAGGNCSFATCRSNEDLHEEANNDVTRHCLDDVIDKWTSECDSKSWKKIKQEIHRMFSSASCLNASFLEQSKDKHFQTSSKFSGLNLSLARRAFKKLVKKDNVFAELEAAVLHLLPCLDKKPVGVEGLRIYLLLNELLHVIQRHKQQKMSTKLSEVVAAAVINLSADSIQVIGDWWSSLSPSTMVRHVKVWKQALSLILSYEPVPRNSGVRNLLLVLQYMYNANSRIAEPRKMPESDFCLLIDKDFLHEDLRLWHLRSQRKNMHAEPLILCSFPILMDLESKQFAFDMSVEITRLEAIQRTYLDLFWEYGCIPPLQDLLFQLNVRRGSVLEDTLELLAVACHSDYKLPLVIDFDENLTMDDIQLYKKDFFHEVFHEMVSVEYGMFMFNNSETLAWFPSKATQEVKRYFQFGLLCGLAMVNQCIIHLPFPLALFKKLLGVKPSLADMIEFSPCVGKSLLEILEDYEDNVIESLYMDFKINWDGTEVDLDLDNPEKPVTGQNKKEFVDAYVNHVFNASVESVFQEFKRGFFQVCDRDLVKLFRPKELQEVLVGKDFQDWAKLKQNTVYEGEYNTTPPHPTIQMFWEVFDELTEDQKKAFLWFVTGFERVPFLKMEKIKMTVKVQQVQDLSYDQYYPMTHTCFSTLELPLYSTKEIMQTKLTEALSNNRRIYKEDLTL